jgi:hypothetical protein
MKQSSLPNNATNLTPNSHKNFRVIFNGIESFALREPALPQNIRLGWK